MIGCVGDAVVVVMKWFEIMANDTRDRPAFHKNERRQLILNHVTMKLDVTVYDTRHVRNV